jgi:hypothetical protein
MSRGHAKQNTNQMVLREVHLSAIVPILSDLPQIEKEIEEAFRAFKKSKDPDTRRALLAEMRRLLEERDRLSRNSEQKDES